MESNPSPRILVFVFQKVIVVGGVLNSHLEAGIGMDTSPHIINIILYPLDRGTKGTQHIQAHVFKGK
jgi:hypothetical protein